MQVPDGCQGDLIVALEAGADLLCDLGELVWVGGEQEGGAGQQGGGSLGAGDDEQTRISGELVEIQVPLVLLPEEALDEVGALDAELDALLQLVADEVHVLVVLRHEPEPAREVDERLEAEPDEHLEPGRLLDRVRDHAHPRVVGRALQRPERRAEAQVPDHVEGRPVVPLPHVERRRPVLAVLVDALDQQVYVRADDGLLLPHRLVREPVRELAPEELVLLAAGVDDRVRNLGHCSVKLCVIGGR